MKIRAGIIGFGPHGKRLLETINKINELEFCGAVDSNPNSFEGVYIAGRAFGNTQDFYREARPELVVIATNGPSHKQLTLEAIAFGARFVMVEKPMACSVDECQQMEAAALAKNIRLSVDQSRRYDPFYLWLRTQVISGEWGDLRTIYIQRPGIGLGCLGVHSFDLASFLANSDVSEVTAWVDTPLSVNPRGAQFVDPGGSVVMQFENKVKAFILQIEDGAGPMTIELNLTAARVKIDEKSGVVEILKKDLSVKPGPGVPVKYEEVTLPAGMTAKPNMFVMLEGALRELISDKSLTSGSAAGKLSVEVLVAAYVSSDSGHTPIKLPLTDASHIKKYLPVT